MSLRTALKFFIWKIVTISKIFSKIESTILQIVYNEKVARATRFKYITKIRNNWFIVFIFQQINLMNHHQSIWLFQLLVQYLIQKLIFQNIVTNLFNQID